MPEIVRLVGEDGKLCSVAFGTNNVGDGTKTFDVHNGGGAGSGAGWWRITKIKSTGSIFETSVTGTIAVGDLYRADGSEIMAIGDEAEQATLSEVADVSSLSLEMTRDEIETTVLGDDVKKYRYGKSDASGTIEGVTMVDSTLAAGGMAGRFMRTIAEAADGSKIITEVDNTPLYVFIYLNKATAAGEVAAFAYMMISLGGYNIGAKSGEAQNWTSGFRITGADPTLYTIANA